MQALHLFINIQLLWVLIPVGVVCSLGVVGSVAVEQADDLIDVHASGKIVLHALAGALGAAERVFGGNHAVHGLHGQRGGQLGIGLLVGAMDIATANNTVAIVMAGPIAKQMSEEYGITGKKSASLLDTFSCIFQGIIPYGAQMLLAISAAAELGETLTAFQIIPFLFYPYLLLISSLVFIFLVPERK